MTEFWRFIIIMINPEIKIDKQNLDILIDIINRAGQKIIEVRVNDIAIPVAKMALKKAAYKLPTPCKLSIEKLAWFLLNKITAKTLTKHKG